MKKIKLFRYVIFLLVMWGTFYWVPIKLFLTSLGKEKPPITVIENKPLLQLIKDKTEVKIKNIKISETEQPFAIMVGIPTQPQLVISRAVYNSFSPSALEYVVIHEAGHYRFWHGLIEVIMMGILFIVGVILIKKFKFNFITVIILGLVGGILLTQLGKVNEIKADEFTAKTMTNPRGMIEATNNFRNYHGKRYTQNDNKILEFLFYRSNPYDNRIKIAEQELQGRTLKSNLR